MHRLKTSLTNLTYTAAEEKVKKKKKQKIIDHELKQTRTAN